MREFENKTALVTGASRGIGRATASALAKAGAHVLVHYGRSRQEAESLVVEIRMRGGNADPISADLGTPDGASLLAKQVRSIVGDRLDVLVLNAGISKAVRIADYTVEDLDTLFATNVRGPFLLVQQLLPVLGEGSSVVVISSLGADTGVAHYRAARILIYGRLRTDVQIRKNTAFNLKTTGFCGRQFPNCPQVTGAYLRFAYDRTAR